MKEMELANGMVTVSVSLLEPLAPVYVLPETASVAVFVVRPLMVAVRVLLAPSV